jgi:transcriptional regulator with XRE-family HTH domain
VKPSGGDSRGLAWRAGVSAATISHLETGKTVNPRLATVMRIANALTVTPTFLVKSFDEEEAVKARNRLRRRERDRLRRQRLRHEAVR